MIAVRIIEGRGYVHMQGDKATKYPNPPPPLLSTQQEKERRRKKPDYQFALIHDALYPLHVVHQLPQPAVINDYQKCISNNRSRKVLYK